MARMWPMSPGAAVVAAQQLALGDDARADPRRDLHEDHVREVAPVRPVLAERHRVDVALEQRGRAEALGQRVGDRVAVPARHQRRVGRPPGDLDRSGHADRGGQDVGVAVPGLARAARRTCAPTHSSTSSGPSAMTDRLLALGERDAGEVADRQPAVARAEVGGQHDADALVEGQRGGPAAAARRPGLGLLDQQPRGEQHAEALHDRRAREAGDVHDVGPGERAALADEPQDPSSGRHGA